jgi:GNAT superfamily N-acetyltransferase
VTYEPTADPPSEGVAVLDPAAADDDAVVAAVSDLINAVYAIAEAGMWREGAARTSPEEVRQLIRTGEIVVAHVDGALAGCLRAQWLDEELAEFGMLAVAPDVRSSGLGRQLIDFAERRAIASGRTTMQLEVLFPRGWSHPSKELLAEWYPRLGYRVVRTGTIEEAYPALAPLLATPCDFVAYHKDLRGGPGPAPGARAQPSM